MTARHPAINAPAVRRKPADALDVYPKLDPDSGTTVLLVGQRSPKGRIFRYRYRMLLRAAVILPAIFAAIAFGLYQWKDGQLAAARAETAQLRAKLNALESAGPQKVCRFGRNGVQNCVMVHKGA